LKFQYNFEILENVVIIVFRELPKKIRVIVLVITGHLRSVRKKIETITKKQIYFLKIETWAIQLGEEPEAVVVEKNETHPMLVTRQETCGKIGDVLNNSLAVCCCHKSAHGQLRKIVDSSFE